MVFVNNNVRTYKNLYIRKIKIRNILETKYSRFTVYLQTVMFVLDLYIIIIIFTIITLFAYFITWYNGKTFVV